MYLDENLSSGIVIQNQIFASAAEFSGQLSPDLQEIREEISLMKRLHNQADEELIDRYLMAAVKEIK